jgi:protocatechuate 3,4-dioxygenase, alpha subunit
VIRTPSQTVGPFYAIGLTRRTENVLVSPGESNAVELHGTLFDGEDRPIGDGLIEIWDGRRWGRSGTDAEGSFAFLVTKPEARVGAPHFDVFVFARGLLRHQLTRIYFPDEDRANALDPVLASLDEAARATLVAAEEDGRLRFDIRMQGDRATVFFAH